VERMTKNIIGWICVRNDDTVVNIFKNREEGVKYLKDLLKQTLKDFDKQDKPCGFDYPIIIPELKIIPVEKRESFLSLL
jgi:hypothetical protein